jgi:exopolyphosphatase/guanosine-5'-triphosphate,3'-diphosphate pyrophosphatase
MSRMENGTLLAAVDLGSNSFRLEIGRHEAGQILRSEYIKETVRQGNGLDESRNLTPEAMQRGWECLARFAERLKGFEAWQVRAVATQTLREARNREAFLAQGNRILGFPIDVIPGREEARLIYEGVARLLPQSGERRLVVDIGGRSTELIIGQQFEAQVVESYRLGSVAWSMRYFARGEFTPQAFRDAEVAAMAVLEEAADRYAPSAWDAAYGSSGTVGAVGDLLLAERGDRAVDLEGLDWLRTCLINAGSADRVRLEGLKDDRRAVIGGGISILRALFELLHIERMQPAEGALRHGVLHGLLDPAHGNADVRATTVQRMAFKFGVDASQARRVEAAATQLLSQLGSPQRDGPELERRRAELRWAAQLHEIGTAISHSDCHKHGAYILDHADVMGFAQAELHRLGLLVLGHRGKLTKIEVDFADEAFVHQLMALRLAVILCHARRDPDLGSLRLRGESHQASLRVDQAWADAHPQSAHLLRQEVVAWAKTPYRLSLQET